MYFRLSSGSVRSSGSVSNTQSPCHLSKRICGLRGSALEPGASSAQAGPSNPKPSTAAMTLRAVAGRLVVIVAVGDGYLPRPDLMKLCDVPTGELNDDAAAVRAVVARRERGDAMGGRPGESCIQILHLVTRDLVAEGVWKV